MRTWLPFAATAVSALALATSAMATSAHAEEAAPAATQKTDSGEIVVTARGRGEKLLQAPVAETALSAKALADSNIRSSSEILAVVPNASFTKSDNSGTAFITIRGITQVRHGESPVAVVVDGVQQVNAAQFTQDLYDIEQIEVMRGPQGALYGRNAVGGAIIINTRKPTEELTADGRISIGNGNDYRAAGSISGPLIGKSVLYRLTASYRDFGGLFNNVTLNRHPDYSHELTLRGELHFDLAPRLTADLRASYAQTNGGALNWTYQGTGYGSDCQGNGTAPTSVDANRVNRRFCANNLGHDHRVVFDTSLRLAYDADFATITNVLAYTSVVEADQADAYPYTASTSDGTQSGFTRSNAISDELRVTSHSNQPLRWMVGAYVLNDVGYSASGSGTDLGEGILQINYAPYGSDSSNPTTTFQASAHRNLSWALFGNLAYDLTSQLEASVGLRYDHDRKAQIVMPNSTLGLPDGCTDPSQAACRREANFHRFQPKFTLNYKVNPDLTLFADYGIGFRSGGYNQVGSAAAGNLPGVYDLVKPESAYTTEAGVKARLMGGALRLAATAYHTIDKNSVYFVYVGAVGAQILVNIDKTQSNGFELEGQFTPVKGLDLFGSFGYTDSTIKAYAYDTSLTGNKAPYIPDTTGLIGAQFRHDLTEKLGLFARLEMEHHGKQYWDPENDTARSAFELVNGQLGLELPNTGWSLTAYARNLFDKAYNAEYVSGGFAMAAQPRTFGLELRGRM